MASTYRNATLINIPASFTGVYTVPSSTTALIQAIHVANKDAAVQTVSAEWTNASNSNAATQLIVNAEIPSISAFQILDKTLVLETGDALLLKSGTADVLDVTISVMEIT